MVVSVLPMDKSSTLRVLNREDMLDSTKTSTDYDRNSDSNIINKTEIEKQNLLARRAEDVSRPIKRYYVDELGFYRHLDPDQRQYVCSNISSANLRRTTTTTDTKLNADCNDGSISKKLSYIRPGGGDGGYEVCYRAIRHDLGISHFDRTEDYEEWKKNWDDYMKEKLTSQVPVTLNRELKIRVRSGIPHDYRCKVWTALIRMRTKYIRSTFGEDIYGVLLRDVVSRFQVPEYNSDANNNMSSKTKMLQAKDPKNNHESSIEKWFKQIELDLLRTLPNNRHFEDPNSRGIHRVRRILRAYACFNQTFGYCQGMNRLAAMALLILPEEDAFWCLVAIIQCIMPKDYYLKPWLAQVDCCVLTDLLEKKLPKLHRHLVKNDIQLTLFTWFFTIFVDGFRPELMLRIWDCF